jgi:hypothetical protein
MPTNNKDLTVKLDLSIISIKEHVYRSRITQSPLGASSGSGHDFSKDPSILLEQYKKAIESKSGSEFQKFGKSLFDLVFQNDVLEKLNKVLGYAKEQNEQIRLILSIIAPELIPIPWEYLFDGNSFLLKSGKSVVRIIDSLSKDSSPFELFRKPIIAISHPTNWANFDSDNHVNEMIENLKKNGLTNPIFLPHATIRDIQETLAKEEADAFYFLGHGTFDSKSGGSLIFENENTKEGEELPAEKLASFFRLSKTRIAFAYLNSCRTGATDIENPFSGVAHRLMLDGNITTVIAMQTPIKTIAAENMACSFMEYLRQGKSAEQSMMIARNAATDNWSWGIPVIYTKIISSLDFDRNRILFLLSADRNNSTYSLSLPTLRMGIPSQQHLRRLVKVELTPNDTYHYKGDTFAVSDHQAAWQIIDLLSNVTSLNKVHIESSENQGGNDATHRFYFGSRSHKAVQSMLATYKSRYQFQYNPISEPNFWTLTDIKTNTVYKLKDPCKLTPDEYSSQDDYGIIEKIYDNTSDRYYFIFAGLGDRATLGCAAYFCKHWEEILLKDVHQTFDLLLKFPGGLRPDQPELINR